ncbi:MAG: RtcB family protein [Candidatus Moraniibacteriota bacterium]|nr:MAG: RtcB family protein [Candidatus Moranbacteria bacterium]
MSLLYKIKKHSPYKREMKTGKMKVPVVFHVQESLMPSESTLEQLESVASNDACFHHIAAMADVHSKPGRKNATGTTVASEKYILPQVNDSDPACGMRLVRTNLNESNFSPKDIDTLFEALVSKVPTKAYLGTFLPFHIITDICRQGIKPLIKHLGIKTVHEAENSLDRGNFFDRELSRQDIYHIIPKFFLFLAQFRSGVLGAAGNHFLDLMKVTGIEDSDKAAKLGIKNGDYLFMVHCGSGILGQYTMYMYTAKKREHLSTAIMMNIGRFFWNTPHRKAIDEIARKIRESDFGKKEPLITFDGDGEDGKTYLAARNACSNFAHANRAVITHNISQTIKSVLNRNPEFDLLYDMPHILVSREEHFGKNIWVHRNGTSRAYGPSRMSDHPVFRETGEPAFMPTSMSTEAYLGVGTDENESSFFSANHGAGKSKDKTDTVVPKNKTELDQKLATKGVRLYNGRSSKVIEQDSAHYKQADDVVASVRENGIAIPVARLQPVAVIMY